MPGLGPALHPAEEDVRLGLGEALALDHPAPVARVHARLQVVLQHRGAGLLDLQEQRILAVSTLEQDDQAASAHAAHADHLDAHVHRLVPVEDAAAIVGQRGL